MTYMVERVRRQTHPLRDFFEKVAPRVGVTADQFARLSGPEALQLYVDTLERAGLSQQEMTFYLEAMASDATRAFPTWNAASIEKRHGLLIALAQEVWKTKAIDV